MPRPRVGPSVVLARIDELIAGGCALVVGLVTPDDDPYATRGWGLTPVPGSPGQFRLIFSSDDSFAMPDGREEHAIAVNVGDPRTTRSVQLKGRSGPPEPADSRDRAAYASYCDLFFTAVSDADGRPRHLLDRMRPPKVVACNFVVDEVFDQTPGPGAGARLSGSRS